MELKKHYCRSDVSIIIIKIVDKEKIVEAPGKDAKVVSTARTKKESRAMCVKGQTDGNRPSLRMRAVK